MATEMTAAEKKVVKGRLSALELAQALGNVTEVCRQRGIGRTQFYVYKKRFEEQGIEGLRDLPPIHHTHPQTTPPEIVEKILEFALENPSLGCNRISNELKLRGISVSGPTIQKILERNEMASKYERMLKLEEKALRDETAFSAETIEGIEKANPCFKERHVESSKPGETLCQDTLYVGALKGVGKVYMQTVVDTYGSYAYGYLHTGKLPEHSAAVIYNDVLPKYAGWGLKVESVLTDNGREYCGTDAHLYEVLLALNDIKHKKTKVKHPQTNGFAERFNRTVKEEFFEVVFRKKLYVSVEELQGDLDEWLDYYNNRRTHQGYRNMGRRPIDTVTEYLNSVRRDG
jgi:transposase InsO family protein